MGIAIYHYNLAANHFCNIYLDMELKRKFIPELLILMFPFQKVSLFFDPKFEQQIN